MTSPMKYSLSSVLEDSRQLANRMRARDESFDSFLCRSQCIKDFLNEKKKAQEGTISLRELSNRIPRERTLGTYVLCVAAENEQVEKLREENRILSRALEEHQTVLDLIMSKYRTQMTQCLYLSAQEAALQQEATGCSAELKNSHSKTPKQKVTADIGDKGEVDKVSALPTSATEDNTLTAGLSKSELSALVQTLYQRIHRLTQLSQESIQTASEMAAQMEARIQQLESENDNLRQLLAIDESMKAGENNNISSLEAASQHTLSSSTAVEGTKKPFGILTKINNGEDTVNSRNAFTKSASQRLLRAPHNNTDNNSVAPPSTTEPRILK